MKITEKMLLDGYYGITNGGNYISIVKNEKIYWSYRSTDQNGNPETVCDIEFREVITLENSRCGIIEIDSDNDNHLSMDKIKHDEQVLWGIEI